MLQTVYADVIRDDQPARARARITPDALMHLPNYHAACSWIVDGARVPSFLATTLEMQHDERRIERPPRARRALAAPTTPAPIPPPKRLADYLKIKDVVPRPEADEPKAPSLGALPQRADGSSDGTRARARSSQAEALRAGSAATPPIDAGARSGSRCRTHPRGATRPARLRTREIQPRRPKRPGRRGRARVADQAGGPGQLHRTRHREPERARLARAPARSAQAAAACARDDLEVLAALHELRFLLTSQIGRRFMHGRAERSVRQRLSADVQGRLAAPLRDHLAQGAATTSASGRSTRPATS